MSIPIYGNPLTDSKDIIEKSDFFEDKLKEQFSEKPIVERYQILSSHISTFLDQMEFFKDILLLKYQVLIQNLSRDLRVYSFKILRDRKHLSEESLKKLLSAYSYILREISDRYPYIATLHAGLVIVRDNQSYGEYGYTYIDESEFYLSILHDIQIKLNLKYKLDPTSALYNVIKENEGIFKKADIFFEKCRKELQNLSLPPEKLQTRIDEEYAITVQKIYRLISDIYRSSPDIIHLR